MRQFDPDFAAHIASGATTLAWCWRLERTDGVVLAFTDHDAPLSFDGRVFQPTNGLEGGEMADRLGAQTQTSEVLGVLTSEAIAEDDIAQGRYDGARIETWRVNWRNVAERARIRVDTLGEITREDGVFRAELRSGQHAMNVPQGRLYQHLCDARLGEARCGVNMSGPAYRRASSVVAVTGPATIEVTDLHWHPAGWFVRGFVEWTSGRRAKVRDAIVAQSGNVLTLARPVAEWVAVGDTLTAFAGCDKQFATCRDKFANGVNFQGFPHIPGNDFVLRYPSSGDRLDGGRVI